MSVPYASVRVSDTTGQILMIVFRDFQRKWFIFLLYSNLTLFNSATDVGVGRLLP